MIKRLKESTDLTSTFFFGAMGHFSFVWTFWKRWDKLDQQNDLAF